MVELIVVLVILAILMAILIPAFTGYIKKAQKTACDFNKTRLLRDLTAEEIYDTWGDTAYTNSKLQALASASEYKCAQGGPYSVSRADNGSIAVICSKHDTNYNFNMNQALDTVIKNNPAIQAEVEKWTSGRHAVDSTSSNASRFSDLIAALNDAGFSPEQSGVKAWSLQGIEKNKYYFYWTTEDITAYSPGDKVKVLRYNSNLGTYTAGYVTVYEYNNKDTGTKYNILGREGSVNESANYASKWTEYKTEDIVQSPEDKKDYNKIYDVFKEMPEKPAD